MVFFPPSQIRDPWQKIHFFGFQLFAKNKFNQLHSCLCVCLDFSGYLCGISMYNMVGHLPCQHSFTFQCVHWSNTVLWLMGFGVWFSAGNMVHAVSCGEGCCFDEETCASSMCVSVLAWTTKLGTNKTPIERIFRQTGSCFLLFLLLVSCRQAVYGVSLSLDQGWLLGIMFWHTLLLELGFLSITVFSKLCGWLYFMFIFWSSCLYVFYSTLLVFLFLASETCNDFHPMFFTHDRSFEEFFCICIQLLNKTWKEMRATSEDFNKARKRVGWE